MEKCGRRPTAISFFSRCSLMRYFRMRKRLLVWRESMIWFHSRVFLAKAVLSLEKSDWESSWNSADISGWWLG